MRRTKEARSGQEDGDANRRQKPAECNRGEDIWLPDEAQIDWEQTKSAETANDVGRDEGLMSGTRERTSSRRIVNQRLEVARKAACTLFTDHHNFASARADPPRLFATAIICLVA